MSSSGVVCVDVTYKRQQQQGERSPCHDGTVVLDGRNLTLYDDAGGEVGSVSCRMLPNDTKLEEDTEIELDLDLGDKFTVYVTYVAQADNTNKHATMHHETRTSTTPRQHTHARTA